MGQIRFQWWRDAVRAAYEDRPPNHPVAIALAHVLHSPGPTPPPAPAVATPAADAAAGGAQADAGCSDSGCGSDSPRSSAAAAAAGSSSGSSGPGRFSRYSFKRIIDVRESDFLDPQPPLDMGALESYAEGTASQLLYLQVGGGGAWACAACGWQGRQACSPSQGWVQYQPQAQRIGAEAWREWEQGGGLRGAEGGVGG
mgnify:CR=1 FL=1